MKRLLYIVIALITTLTCLSQTNKYAAFVEQSKLAYPLCIYIDSLFQKGIFGDSAHQSICTGVDESIGVNSYLRRDGTKNAYLVDFIIPDSVCFLVSKETNVSYMVTNISSIPKSITEEELLTIDCVFPMADGGSISSALPLSLNEAMFAGNSARNIPERGHNFYTVRWAKKIDSSFQYFDLFQPKKESAPDFYYLVLMRGDTFTSDLWNVNDEIRVPKPLHFIPSTYYKVVVPVHIGKYLDTI